MISMYHQNLMDPSLFDVSEPIKYLKGVQL